MAEIKMEVPKIEVTVVGKMDLPETSKHSKSNLTPKLVKKQVFETETILFFEGKHKKIIGKHSSGKVALIDFKYKGTMPSDNESWKVEVIKIDEKKVFVRPVELVTSASDNQKAFMESITKLKNKEWNKATSRSNIKTSNIRNFNKK